VSTLPTLEAYYEDLLYRLLPELYRSRDSVGDLRRFMAVFGHEVARIRANLDSLWRDFYIDSCQDWVIPYIADLVDTGILFNEGARNRADVKNTMKWRRQKGTLAGLEDIASEITGWGARGVEMMTRIVRTQNLNHLRPQALHTLDFSNGSRLSRLRTPFDLASHNLDIRPSDSGVGLYQVAGVALSEWTIPSQPWSGTDPFRAATGRYFFHPLGRDQILHSGGDVTAACAGAGSNPDTLADICYPHVKDTAVRGRDFRDNPRRYFGQPSGFTVYEDGIPVAGWAASASPSTVATTSFIDLLAGDGLRIADTTLFGSPSKRFRITAVRLATKTNIVNGEPVPVPITPAGPFANNYQVDGEAGDLDTTAFTYATGVPFHPDAPDFHQPYLVLRIERLAADTEFPECELIVRAADGARLLVFLPARTGFAATDEFHLYVADDGSTYFARADHGAGAVDLNPNSAAFGAMFPRHLARAAQGQVRPRSGIRPFTPRTPVYRRLCCWDQPLLNPPKPGELAIDPERGRFMFPAGENPQGAVTVDFRFAITGQAGAGPYFRGDLPPATHKVGKASNAQFQTIQAAINAAAGSAGPVIIEIEDSRVYPEALVVNQNFDAGLTIRAAVLAMPVLKSPAGDALSVTGACPSLMIDGVTVSGGAVMVAGSIPSLQIKFCSLDPGSSSLDYSPTDAGATLSIANSITGPIGASTKVASISISDSILQHVTGGTAISSQGGLTMERSTVLGATGTQALTASNCIFLGALNLADIPASCMRYTRHPKNLPPVRRFRCTSGYPIFGSVRFGHPAYAHLTRNTADSVRKGGEDGGEMGCFYQAGIPWREQNVQKKLQEYLPAGLRPAFVEALPVPAFAGMRRI
jgi:hypothetical protein